MKHSVPVIMLLLLVSPDLRAEVPSFVTYSGRLTDGIGVGESTTLSLTVRIYDCGCEPGGQCDKPCNQWPGTPLHEQSFAAAPVEDGYFSVILTGVADVFSAHDQTWITVCVGEGCTPEDDLLPRQAVGSVPYALRTERAEKLVEPNSYVQNQTALPQAASFNIDGSGYFGGHVGIGTTNPTSALTVANGGAEFSGACVASHLVLSGPSPLVYLQKLYTTADIPACNNVCGNGYCLAAWNSNGLKFSGLTAAEACYKTTPQPHACLCTHSNP